MVAYRWRAARPKTTDNDNTTRNPRYWREIQKIAAVSYRSGDDGVAFYAQKFGNFFEKSGNLNENFAKSSKKLEKARVIGARAEPSRDSSIDLTFERVELAGESSRVLEISSTRTALVFLKRSVFHLKEYMCKAKLC